MFLISVVCIVNTIHTFAHITHIVEVYYSEHDEVPIS